MTKKKATVQRGFTITELAITIAISTIVIVGIAVILVDSQRGWHNMYNHTYADTVPQAYIARKTFDSVIRKADKDDFLIDDNGSWLEIYYYADDDSTALDRYAYFYQSGGDLNVEYGQLDPRTTLTTQTICQNVSDCVFTTNGRSAQMILIVDDGSTALTVISSAVMHN